MGVVPREGNSALYDYRHFNGSHSSILRIINIAAARPNLPKIAPSRARCTVILIHAGQH